MRWKRVAGTAALAVIVAVPVLAWRAARTGPVELNQHFVEDHWFAAGAFNARERALACWSRLRAGAHRLTTDAPGTRAVRLDQPQSVFSYVFAQIPPLAIVYPTETYYYWSFPFGSRTIHGNLRLLDADRGLIHIGYFDADDQEAFGAGTFGAKEGLKVQAISSHRFRVTWEGRTVTFVLPQRVLHNAAPRLTAGEKVITGVLDESGIPLVLLFHQGEKAFYYVLNQRYPPCDELIPIEKTGGAYLVGKRTRYVFFHDKAAGRKLLVGVRRRSIEDNDYYDGPFDQVPPRLPLRPMLEASYPYLRLAGGIDLHGNFLEMEGQRVAISPYQAYETLNELKLTLDAMRRQGGSGPKLWALMTYESKRDFHKSLPQREAPGSLPSLYGSEHRVWNSQGWPANHWGDNSRGWPLEHQAPISGGWPPNHNSGLSRGTAKGLSAPAAVPKAHDAGLSREMIRRLRKPAAKSGGGDQEKRR